MEQRNPQLPDFDESVRPRWRGPRRGAVPGWGAGFELIQIHDHLRAESQGLLEAIDNTEADRSQARELNRIAVHLNDRLSSHLSYEESQLVAALNVYG